MNTSDKKRIRWQCRRGMLELDIMLSHFLDNGYEQLSLEQKEIFKKMLSLEDDQLYRWFMGYEPCQDPKMKPVVEIVSSV